MSKLRCIIVDDEPIARKGMKRLVESRPELELAAVLPSAEEASAYLAAEGAALVFLDIEMPGASGVELARTLPRDCMVIFTTAYSEYAAESYEVEAVDYLLKPIDPARFGKAVDKALDYRRLMAAASMAGCAEPARGSEGFIIVKSDRRYVRVRLDDILYVQGLKDYVILQQPGSRVITRMTVKALEELLPPGRFMRAGKSYIVNMDKIDSFDANDLYIADNVVPIGAMYREAVMGRLLGL